MCVYILVFNCLMFFCSSLLCVAVVDVCVRVCLSVVLFLFQKQQEQQQEQQDVATNLLEQ